MDMEKRFFELEQKVIGLERVMNEHKEYLNDIKNGFNTIEKMLTEIKRNPFGINL